jgi:thiosulfate/3-mercaptopyruvate sulfurtransferase
MTTLRDPDALISTEDLAARLGQPGLRVYDCTTYLEPPDPGSDDPYKAVSGLKTFVAGHVPGADFLDLQGELSATDTRLKFTMPPAEQLAPAFGRHGLGDGARVVLYSIGSMMWATRVWWMLRSLGFDGAAVLDGGFDRWQAEGRPIEAGEPHGYPPAKFTPRVRAGHFVDKTAVRAAIGDPKTVTVNALGPQFHRGLEPSRPTELESTPPRRAGAAPRLDIEEVACKVGWNPTRWLGGRGQPNGDDDDHHRV